MKTGITGLPYSGKTTLFCSLTGQKYGLLTHSIETHLGMVNIPDTRLEKLYDIIKPKKTVYTTMEFFDIAGQSVVQGRVMEPSTLQTLKNADSLITVLDAFKEDNDPHRDFRTLMDEFAFNDLVVATKRIERLEKGFRTGDKDKLLLEKEVLKKCRDVLESGGMLRELELVENEKKVVKGFQFLSLKPFLIVINISEKVLISESGKEYEEKFSAVKNAVCSAVCAELEMEITMLDEEDRPEFLASMGIDEPALGRIIRLSHESLGLISFFTAGGTDEVRAWTAHKGMSARECAGIIHSDMERGFIRAETISSEELVNAGSFKAAREQGLLRIEGKDYIVQDGDVLTILFSV